ncbi:hypothetical protein CsSME_00012867 [Camellia sinensis var. sinensis]
MAASMDGMYLAVAGLHGYELLFYPQYHLNQSTLLCRKPLFAKPVVMDVFQGYLLVTYRPFDVHIFHVKFSCELAPSSTPDLQLRRSFSPTDKIEEALLLAQPSAQKTHFSHCLEWLLFKENVIHLAVIGMGGISYLAWGLGLFEECFQQRWYWTGSLYTYKPPLKFLKASKRLFEVVIAELEDPTVSQYCALCLLQAELDESLYELAGELYAHVTSVKNILESHASNLMLAKELSKLVAFVKGAQFDLLEYLQRKRYGSACLENFASGIKLIGQKAMCYHQKALDVNDREIGL